MSRARVHEVSSPISLFPFIGILLCTMGALLVILVAVSRSARNTATAEVAAKQRAEPVDNEMREKMDFVKGYVGKLTKVRSDAETKLREQHKHLSNLEDHINRMHERMRSLEAAAQELNSLEREHYDDRAQAQRETERLTQLIQEARETITSMQDSAEKAPSSYAVVPYEGPNGTYRRPMYIECVKEGVILQPEGLLIPTQDLLPPYGAGNPLAATLRATRDHLIKLYPKEAQSRSLEPYPLLLVRSQGLITYDRARQAIEAGDFDLGFELVEDDWTLKFPAADPQLAALQQQALVQARARQELLAAAAPRAYRDHLMDDSQTGADDGENDYDPYDQADGEQATLDTASGGAIGAGGNGSGGSRGGGMGTPGLYTGGTGPNSGVAGRSGRGGGGYSGGGGDGSGDGVAGSASAGGASGAPSVAWSASPAAAGGSGMGSMSSAVMPTGASVGAGGGGATSSGMGGAPMSAGGDPTTASGQSSQQTVDAQLDAAPPAASDGSQPGIDYTNAKTRHGKPPTSLAESRGKDWALRQKPNRATPVRRTIRVAVQEDKLVILTDDATGPANTLQGKVIPFNGDTVQSMDEFVKLVREHIDEWGIAGNNLYWRPVILLSVSPQGQRRANDLERLLKNSGLELRGDETASNAWPRKVQ